MSEMFRCGDHEALVEYLYDEGDPVRRESIAAHLAICPSCAAELAALSGTQETLAAWQVPPAELGFRLPVGAVAGESAAAGESTGEVTVLRPAFGAAPAPASAWWRQPLPAWAQVAAAALIFASGMAAGVSRGSSTAAGGASAAAGATTVTTPASVTLSRDTASRDTASRITRAPQTAQVNTASVSAEGAAATVTARDLAAVEQRLRSEMSRIQAVHAPAAAGSNEAVMRQVRALIADSERRQRNDTTMRIAQVLRTTENQRQVDMTQVQYTVGQLQQLTGAAVRDQRAKVDMLLRTASFAR